jgi:hypothetical protein
MWQTQSRRRERNPQGLGEEKRRHRHPRCEEQQKDFSPECSEPQGYDRAGDENDERLHGLRQVRENKKISKVKFLSNVE